MAPEKVLTLCLRVVLMRPNSVLVGASFDLSLNPFLVTEMPEESEPVCVSGRRIIVAPLKESVTSGAAQYDGRPLGVQPIILLLGPTDEARTPSHCFDDDSITLGHVLQSASEFGLIILHCVGAWPAIR
jgi:hypothetical protein